MRTLYYKNGLLHRFYIESINLAFGGENANYPSNLVHYHSIGLLLNKSAVDYNSIVGVRRPLKSIIC